MENINLFLKIFNRYNFYLFKKHVSSGENSKAELVLMHILKKEPDNHRALNEYAKLASQRSDWDEAVKRWENVISCAKKSNKTISPKTLNKLKRAQINLANEQLKSDDLETAEKNLKKTLDIKSDDIIVLSKLAEIAFQKKDWINTEKQWENIIEISSTNNEKPPEKSQKRLNQARIKLAKELKLAGKLKKAETLIEKVIKNDPINIPALTLFAEIATDKRDWINASERWKEVIKTTNKYDKAEPPHAQKLLKKANSKIKPTPKKQFIKQLINNDLKEIIADVKNNPNESYDIRAFLNTLDKSEYAYGIYYAALIAQRLEIKGISAIEFGVAGGNGLLAMEEHANEIEKIFNIKIDVYGFDTGEGMPPPQGYRDMPYMFAETNYKMDVDKLESRLLKAKLILGNIKETTLDFFDKYTPLPIGFVSFDMDYYSSTIDALTLFSDNNEDLFYLPRIFMHFDDTVGNEITIYNDFVGELAAIKDFNIQNKNIKITQNKSFKRFNINLDWYNKSYIMNRFNHRHYSKYISKATTETLSLK